MKVVVQDNECYLDKYFNLDQVKPHMEGKKSEDGSRGYFRCVGGFSKYVDNFRENLEYLDSIRTDPDFIKFVEDGYKDIENSNYSRFVKDSIFRTWFSVIELPDNAQFYITQDMDIDNNLFDPDKHDDYVIKISDRVVYINEDGDLVLQGLSFLNLPAKGDKYE